MRGAGVSCRRLQGREDRDVFRQLRLSALRLAPLSFGVTLEEALAMAPEDWDVRMAASAIFAAFVEGEAVGLAALGFDPLASHAHRTVLSMVFVTPEARGKGVADDLVTYCCDWAKAEGLLQVELIVSGGNEAARQIYLRNGFVDYGLLPRGRRIGDHFVDDVLMVRMLD